MPAFASTKPTPIRAFTSATYGRATATRLATVTFTNETASGWQQALFATPVAITSNTVYVASYHANNGHYSEDTNYFAEQGVDHPPLHALADGVSGGNGVYAYGASSVFPSQTWKAANYWVDVLFVGDSPANEHFVDLSNSAPSWPYADWTTAATNIQDAVDAASAGDTVWVADGVYATGGRTAGGQAMTNRVAIDKPLTVQSVHGPRVTMIQGQGPLGADAVRCAYVTNGAKLVGFTLTNGFTDKRLGEFVVKAGEGGGVYCESTAGTVSNCILIGNSANVRRRGVQWRALQLPSDWELGVLRRRFIRLRALSLHPCWKFGELAWRRMLRRRALQLHPL